MDYRIGSNYDDNWDIVNLWISMSKILKNGYNQTRLNRYNLTPINLIKFSETLKIYRYFQGQVLQMWRLTELWLRDLADNNYLESYERDNGELVTYNYPFTKYEQFPIFTEKYSPDTLRRFAEIADEEIEEYHNIIHNTLREGDELTSMFGVFDFRVIMLLLDISLVRCRGNIADTYLFKYGNNLKPYTMSYYDSMFEEPGKWYIKTDWLKQIFDEFYGTRFFHLASTSGNFAFNTWLWAYLNDVEIIGVPYGLSEADGKVMCPFQFIKHDRFHGEIFAQIKDKTDIRKLYSKIYMLPDIELKELLIFSLWLMVHEGACLPTECGFDHLIMRTFAGMWTGAWNWVIDSIYPKLVKYFPNMLTIPVDVELLEKHGYPEIREVPLRDVQNYLIDLEIEGTDANLTARTLIGCYTLIIFYGTDKLKIPRDLYK